jgi:carbamoylphosphate synthase large subunit
MKKEKIGIAVIEAFERLYDIASPKTSFKELMDKYGKDIPFSDYSVLKNDYDKIIEEVRLKYKIKRKIDKETYYFNIHLGCSPKTI